MSSPASLIQSLAPWSRLLCCFGLHSFQLHQNRVSEMTCDLLRQISNREAVLFKAAGLILLMHTMSPELFTVRRCTRCGFQKVVA